MKITKLEISEIRKTRTDKRKPQHKDDYDIFTFNIEAELDDGRVCSVPIMQTYKEIYNQPNGFRSLDAFRLRTASAFNMLMEAL